MSQVGDSRGNEAVERYDPETFIGISKTRVVTIEEMDYESDYKQEILSLTKRPQVLIDSERQMIAVFFDADSFPNIIKMINNTKEGVLDLDIILVAKLWKQLKPMLENLEIKNI